MRHRSTALFADVGRMTKEKTPTVECTTRVGFHSCMNLDVYRTYVLGCTWAFSGSVKTIGPVSLPEVTFQESDICTRYLSAVTRSRSRDLWRLESHCPTTTTLLVPSAFFCMVGSLVSLSGTSGVGELRSGILPHGSTRRTWPT